MYDRAITFDDENVKAFHWRGVAGYREKNFEAALVDLEQAININPRHFESYQVIDRIFSESGQWERIIAYWDRFLALEPDHAEAYLEVSGSHYRNKDMENARINMKKACDLGNKKACGYLKRFGG